jgi:hypothetical protein
MAKYVIKRFDHKGMNEFVAEKETQEEAYEFAKELRLNNPGTSYRIYDPYGVLKAVVLSKEHC